MSTLTATQLQQQYIAYFGRPGDPAGIKYWLSSSSGITTAREFADKIYAQDEYKTTTVASKTTEEQVNSLYVNLFGRQADSAGLLYWTGEIQNGNLQLSNIAVNLIAAATNPISGNETQGALDAQALANKVAAAESFTAELEKSTTAILAYQAESITPWVSGDAFASGVSFIKTATDSNAPTATDAASAVTTMIAASTASTVPDSKNLKLTANTDALVGDGGTDTISAVLQDAGATGTTVAPGDSVDGKAGTDTFTISVAGNIGDSGYTISAVTLDNVEKLFLSNFSTNANGGVTTVETGLMTGLTTVGLSSSGQYGDTKLNGMKNNVDAEMRNGSGNLNLDYNGSYVVTGTADTQKLTVSALTGGAFAANKIETINITSELAKSKLDSVTSDKLINVNVTGSQDLEIATALAFDGTLDTTTIDGTIDASAFTGKLTVGTSSSSTINVKGGTGADTFKFAGTLTTNDVVAGGDGDDTLTMTAATAAAPLDKQFTNVSSIETVAFDATTDAARMDVSKLSAGVTTVQLDLADGNDGGSTTDTEITNLGSQAVVLKRTAQDAADTGGVDGVTLKITGASDTSADTVNVTLDAINTGVRDGLVGLDVGNYETVNITSKKGSRGATAVTGNEVATLTASSATSVVLTGDADTTLTSIVGDKITSFDASALVGTLTATFADNKITAKAATKNTTFNFTDKLDNNDTIIGGAGTEDKVTATAWTGKTVTTGKLNISDVETLDLATTGDNKIDLSNVTGLKNLELDGSVQTITGFDLGTTIVSSDAATSVKVTAADSTGTSDILKLQSNLDTAIRTNTVEATGIETLAITTNDSSSGSVHEVTYALGKFEGTKVSATQKSTAGNSNVQLGTLHKNVTTVDTTGIKGTQKFNLSDATAATTSDLAGTGKVTATGSAKADTFTVGKTAGVAHNINAGAGTDTITVTVDTGFVNPSDLRAENVTLDLVAGNVDIVLADNEPFNSNADGGTTAITITGGNSLTSFSNIGFTTTYLADTVKTFNAGTFGGLLKVGVADNKLDDTLTITGGSNALDEVTSKYTATGSSSYKPNTSGVEILKIEAAGSTIAPVLDLSNTTGVTTIEAKVGTGDTLKIDKAVDHGVTVTGAADAAGVVEYILSDATGSSDAVTFELKGTIADGAQLKTTDIETVTVKNATAAEDISLANLSMTTAGETMKLVATGNQALTVRALNEDVTTIDASGMDEGGSFVQTGRSSTAASTYTGSDGDDTFMMNHGDDAIAAGAGTGDNLVVTKNLILGGIKVDLSKTGDQVTTFNGNSNSAVQSGFESVDLSNITGSFGSEITAIKGGSTIIGTANTDVITGGAGADTITGGNGIDEIAVGAGGDTVSLTGISAVANRDNVTGFVSGTDDIGLSAALTADGTLANAAAEAFVGAVTKVNDGAFNLDGSYANTDAKDIFILTGGNEGEADLSAVTDGAQLMKYLANDSNTVTELTTGSNENFYIAAFDGGNTYIYHAAPGNAAAVASEISLVATLTGTASVVAGDFVMVA